MKFNFEFLVPNEEVVKIFESFEKLGYVIKHIHGIKEQWDEACGFMTFCTTIPDSDTYTYTEIRLPKSLFKKKLEYQRWMKREDFEELCKQDENFSHKDCVLSANKLFLYKNVLGDNINVSGCLCNFKLAFYSNHDSSWCDADGNRVDVTDYHYVCLITE